MKKITKYIFIITIVILAVSCSMYKTTIPQANMQAQLNLSLDDLVYLKDATGTATQSYILGLPIGGTKYKTTAVSNVANDLIDISSLKSRGFNAAMYDAMESVPDADFVLPVSLKVKRDVMFLGRQDSLIVKVKAFKLKTK